MRLSKRLTTRPCPRSSSAVKRFLLETQCPGIRKPIRLDEFRAVVAHVGEAKPLVASVLPARWFTPDSIYLYSGEITGRHILFCLLNRVYAARLTGVLVVQPGRVEKKLYFNLGNLIFAASNLPGDGLGEMMLREGALTQYQFDVATERMQRGQRFGDALVDLGAAGIGLADTTGMAPQQAQAMAEGRVTSDLLLTVRAHPGGAAVHVPPGSDRLHQLPRVLRALPGGGVELDRSSAPSDPDDVAARQRAAVDDDLGFAVRHACS